jgi:hypothetical protein
LIENLPELQAGAIKSSGLFRFSGHTEVEKTRNPKLEIRNGANRSFEFRVSSFELSDDE